MSLRFIFEAYLELVICVAIGMLNLQWDPKNFSIQYGTIFTILFVILVIFMPLFTLIFYYYKIDSVEDEEFKNKYGTLYEGLELDMDKDKRKEALIYPFLFILRRIVFMITVIFMAHFTWSQIAVNFASSFAMVIYFGFVWPFENHGLTKIEIFNEVITILLCYFMLCFTDWVQKAEIRYAIGWIFILVISLHLGLHLIILLHNTYMIVKQKAREKLYKKKSSTPNTP